MKVVIGRIGSTYGVKGWLKLQSFTEPEDNIIHYHTWYLESKNGWQEITCDEHNFNGPKLLIHIKGYDTPEAAKLLANKEIAIDRDQLPPLPEGEFYWQDLIGLDVVTLAGASLGKATQILHNAAHPILMIEGEKTHLLPLLMGQFIDCVDLKQGRILVKWDPEF